MVGEQVGESAICPHGDALRASKVIFGDDSIGHFVVIANKDRGACAKV